MPEHVPPAPPTNHFKRFVNVDGIRTHYLEAGAGPPLILLHSGEFGACAELSWEYNIGALSRTHRVIAPDWLGFGETDKVKDFVSGHRRMLDHMVRFLEVLDVGEADFVANSMGATFLVRDAASPTPQLPVRRMVIASGGGFSPDNEHRQALLDYDCTIPSMRRVIEALFHDPLWWSDDAYVERRHRLSLVPGAWECAAAARFRSPVAPQRSDFGVVDETPYERVAVPVLIAVGTHDKLRLSGYGNGLVEQIPLSQLVEFERSGHCPHIEQAATFNARVTDFLMSAAP